MHTTSLVHSDTAQDAAEFRCRWSAYVTKTGDAPPTTHRWTAGLVPLSYPQMMGSVELFNNGGAGRAAQRAKWLLHRQTVVSKVLALSVKEKTRQGKKRKTVNVSGRLLTGDDFRRITAVPTNRRSVDCVKQQVYECVG
uniref:Uncharacterized protein n=1 Tax=Hyaloperonospora arabidopsidis (strain Emoy2) TaxID=559515 RepID=M4BSY3_HYAAE